MPEIDATVGGPEANSYLTLADADKAMDGYANAKKWLSLDEATRQRHLLDITRKIDRFKNWTPKTSTQRLAFPSSVDPVGDAIRKEVTNALLDGLDFVAGGEMKSLKKLQAEGVTNRSLMGQSSTFKADESGLPAGSRTWLEGLWRLYSAPRLVQQSHRKAFSTERSTGSAFDVGCTPPQDNGPLSEI